MPDDMTPLFEDGPVAPSKSRLDIAEQIIKIFAIGAIPIVVPISLAVYSAKVQAGAQEETINRDYVQLAVSVLKDKKDVDPGIRDWAVDLLAEHSPTKFKPEVIAALKSGAVSLPSPTDSRLPEAVSPDKKTIARADSLGIQVIDAATSNRKFMLPITTAVTALAFSHHGDILAVGFADQNVSLYKIETGEKYLNDFPVDLLFDVIITKIIFDRDDKGFTAVTSAGNKHIRF
jgi:WD40 repeat protein